MSPSSVFGGAAESLTADCVIALRSDGSELGRLLLKRPTVVMTQWALGEANSARWDREARAVLSR